MPPPPADPDTLPVPRRGEWDAPSVSVVVPLFNERDTLPELARRVGAVLAALGLPAEIVAVDDGSTDGTAELLDELAAADGRFVAVHLSRNFGHQAALSAGLDRAAGDVVVFLDGDLQDPPEMIPRFLECWRGGADVVYATRASRPEGAAKRLAYWLFYRLLAGADAPIPADAGDFGLMDRRVADAVRAMPERGRFVRGLRAYAGFRQEAVPCPRGARHAGAPKYTLRKLLRLARAGLIGFTAWPIRLIGAAGAATLGLSVLALLTLAAAPTTVPGWGWVLAAVALFGGANLLALGVLGEYLYRVLEEVLGRPAYVVRSAVGAGLARPTVRRRAGRA